MLPIVAHNTVISANNSRFGIYFLCFFLIIPFCAIEFTKIIFKKSYLAFLVTLRSHLIQYPMYVHTHSVTSDQRY